MVGSELISLFDRLDTCLCHFWSTNSGSRNERCGIYCTIVGPPQPALHAFPARKSFQDKSRTPTHLDFWQSN